MKTGLVFGKFMPLHIGHISLINFARINCDRLYVVICYTKEENIPGMVRIQWLNEVLKKDINIILFPFEYDENELTNTSVSSRTVSYTWAKKFRKLLPAIDVVFTSEDYGHYVAEFMNIKHVLYDKNRIQTPISASTIRRDPFKYWNYLADIAKPYFVKKISILGSESTGKSTLTKRLAAYYQTVFVAEAGREVVAKTQHCSLQDLDQIVKIHAKKIIEKIPYSNKLLFIDTDLNITKSYAAFLFNEELITETWEEEANRSDFYFFLETDCHFIQDGTRLNESERMALSKSHKKILKKNNVNYIPITGSWEERFIKVCEIIDTKYFNENA